MALTLLVDSDAHSAIIGNLKRAFSRSPIIVAFLRKHRREQQWTKKDGTVAKKPHVFYKCFKCQLEFNSANIQVDHIEPVVPLNIPSKHLSYDTLIKRLFCDESNLQILCKEHHKEKSQQENAIRKDWLSKTKFIVYETVNKKNHKRYIGVHKCEDYDDFYLGSGNLIKQAIQKYGKDNFYRHILFVFDNAQDAFAKEAELVNDEVITSDKYYNLALGGIGNTSGIKTDNLLSKSVICHQTGQVFTSISEVAKNLDVSISSISKAINDPDQPVKNLHFFLVEDYDPKVRVTFPALGRKVVHLNSRNIYQSIKAAAVDLSLNYKSLRNACGQKNNDGLYCLDEQYFLYEDEYDSKVQYCITKQLVKCVELEKTFSSYTEAAKFLKHKNPAYGGIAIGKAIRKNHKAFKYHWELVTEKVNFKLV